ncbi:hypothetical protein J2X45_002228 [Caulobacter sp. BE264]|nr:hypothetical protein [Caulobacter sp. BE264]
MGGDQVCHVDCGPRHRDRRTSFIEIELETADDVPYPAIKRDNTVHPVSRGLAALQVLGDPRTRAGAIIRMEATEDGAERNWLVIRPAINLAKTGREVDLVRQKVDAPVCDLRHTLRKHRSLLGCSRLPRLVLKPHSLADIARHRDNLIRNVGVIPQKSQVTFQPPVFPSLGASTEPQAAIRRAAAHHEIGVSDFLDVVGMVERLKTRLEDLRSRPTYDALDCRRNIMVSPRQAVTADYVTRLLRQKTKKGLTRLQGVHIMRERRRHNPFIAPNSSTTSLDFIIATMCRGSEADKGSNTSFYSRDIFALE